MKLLALAAVSVGCWTSSSPAPAEPVAPVATVEPVRRAAAEDTFGGDGYGGSAYGGFLGGVDDVYGGGVFGGGMYGGGGLGGGGFGGGGVVGGVGGGGVGIGVGKVGGYGGSIGGRRPIVRPAAPAAQGGLDRAIIQRYIRRNINRVRYCYEQALLGQPDLAGKVTAQFTIGPDGKVQASIAGGLDPSVDTCVAAVISKIQFPRPTTGANVNVVYPFVFTPG